jgi:HK97 family phage portal protein
VGLLLPKAERRSGGIAGWPLPAFPGVGGGGSGVGPMSSEGALSVPTVWACVSLIANAVSMMPLKAYDLNALVPTPLPLPPVLLNPAAGMTQSEWLNSVMVSLLLRGNCYGQIVSRSQVDGRPTQIELLNPDTVTVKIDRQTGDLTYKVGRVDVPTEDIWHVRGMTLPGGKVGQSPIAAAASVLTTDISSRQFAGDYFNAGGIPKAVLTSSMDMNQQQATTLKERLLAATRSREPLVLAAGVEYKPIQVSPEESQFLATQEASVSQIARYFSVLPEMVGGSSGGPLHYSSPELNATWFLNFTLMFWLKRLEDALFPVLPGNQYAAFDSSALLRADALTQAQIEIIQIAGRVRTRDEVRAANNLPPMTEAQLASLSDVPDLTITPKGGAKAEPLPLPPAA